MPQGWSSSTRQASSAWYRRAGRCGAGGELVVVNAGTLRRKAALMGLGEYLPVMPELPPG
jgi:hypothetical protein